MKRRTQKRKVFISLCKTFALAGALVVLQPPASASPKTYPQLNLQQKEIEIRGKIIDAQGPIPGVSITLKGTKIGSSTDANGLYSIKVPEKGILVFQMLGYQSQEIPVNSKQLINVTLVEDNQQLSEVVVVGYGTQKKANLTGSVATVDAKQLENRPVTNLTNAIQGTMPGVTVTQNNGQPGKEGSSIRVRGIGTLNNSDPVVVVDGVISSMNDVNPEDVENISILKDAASAAIYGSRAANGVVLITTKKGKAGQTKISYNGYIGKQSATALPDYLPSWDAAILYNQALKNEHKPLRYTDAEIQKFRDGSDPLNYPNTDWLGLFYDGSGLQQNHYLNLNGGTDKTQYAFSLGVLDQDGLVKGTNTKRYTSRLNLSSTVSEKLKVNASLAYTRGEIEEPQSSYVGAPEFSQIVRQINRIAPMVPYKDQNGHYGYISDGSPMAWLESGSYNRELSHYLFGTVNADWEIAKDLHFKPMLATIVTINKNKKFINDIQYYDRVTGEPSMYQGPNNLTDQNYQNSVTTLQATLDYAKSFNKHNFKALAGYSQEYTKYDWDEGYRRDFLNNNLGELNAGPIAGQRATGYAYELALQSVFGRLNYDYDGKYLIEANLRYDGSSRFADGNRWGIYPSVSAGWNLDREAFFEPLKAVVSSLKLRGSWGNLGNQNVTKLNDDYPESYPYYPYIATVSSGQDYVFGGASPVIATGISPVNGANMAIQWEKTTETGIGFDAGFLSGKLTFSADYFNKKTNNILLSVPVGEVYGLNAPVQNAGAVRNRGFEFVASYQNSAGDFEYNISANAAFIKNEITDLNGTGPIIDGGTFRDVGYPINAFYGYIAEGIFQSQEEVDAHATQSGGEIGPGDLKYKDVNQDGVINGDDRTYLGTYFPKVAFGLNLGGSWKGIDLTLFFQGAAGVDNYIQGIMLGQVSSSTGKPTSALSDSWTPENTSASMPRLWSTFTQNDPGRNPSSFWVKNASYIRLKNLQLGYTLPKRWTDKIGTDRIRIYYSGQNLFTASSFYKWVDPESPQGASGYDYPQVKINTIGLNVTF